MNAVAEFFAMQISLIAVVLVLHTYMGLHILIVPVAGVLLAYGFLMIPAAIGALFSRRWASALLIGWLSGLAACLLGIVYSYRTDSPYGPSLLLAMGAFFAAALFIRGVIPEAGSSDSDLARRVREGGVA